MEGSFLEEFNQILYHASAKHLNKKYGVGVWSVDLSMMIMVMYPGNASKITKFWETVGTAIERILRYNIPMDISLLYFCNFSNGPTAKR